MEEESNQIWRILKDQLPNDLVSTLLKPHIFPAAFPKPRLNPYPASSCEAGMYQTQLSWVFTEPGHRLRSRARVFHQSTDRHVRRDGPQSSLSSPRWQDCHPHQKLWSYHKTTQPLWRTPGLCASPKPLLWRADPGQLEASWACLIYPLAPTPHTNNLWGFPSLAAEAKPSHNLLMVPTSALISAPAVQEAQILSWWIPAPMGTSGLESCIHLQWAACCGSPGQLGTSPADSPLLKTIYRSLTVTLSPRREKGQELESFGQLELSHQRPQSFS